MSPIPIDNPSEKVGEEDITFEFFELCEECGLTMLLDIAHTKERCDENQFPFYYKISSEFIAEVLNASQNKFLNRCKSRYPQIMKRHDFCMQIMYPGQNGLGDRGRRHNHPTYITGERQLGCPRRFRRRV